MTKIRPTFRDYLSEDLDGDVIVYTIDKRDILEMVNAEIDSYNNRNDDSDENPDYEPIDHITNSDIDKDFLNKIVRSYKQSFDEWLFQERGGQKQYGIIAPFDTWSVIEDFVESKNK